ncbi:hypothetical protein APX70_200046 [Pseudomonas syringae pv. maculicola]|uniref:Uncharacterized protein n=1 Tax=Pseudomonas syringae pv. maculicola TaxID=59511 RepID=A0A3M2VHM7_PSEYM|nr:hypothetical protein APX70_200046 [Pseudomonas syringae pv. maculicola]
MPLLAQPASTRLTEIIRPSRTLGRWLRTCFMLLLLE